MELANPSFKNNFFSNQWLPYNSINNAFTNGCNENTIFHEAVIQLRHLCLLLISLTDCLVIACRCLSSLQKRLSQYYIFFYDDEIQIIICNLVFKFLKVLSILDVALYLIGLSMSAAYT